MGFPSPPRHFLNTGGFFGGPGGGGKSFLFPPLLSLPSGHLETTLAFLLGVYSQPLYIPHAHRYVWLILSPQTNLRGPNTCEVAE